MPQDRGKKQSVGTAATQVVVPLDRRASERRSRAAFEASLGHEIPRFFSVSLVWWKRFNTQNALAMDGW